MTITTGPLTISVVLPTRDRDTYLEEATRSVLDQEYGDLELLIVDDGSREPIEPRWRRRLADSRVRWFRTPGLGPGPNIDFALDRVRGDVVTFIGDDDRWHPGFLAEVARVFRADPGRDALASSYHLIDHTGRRLGSARHVRHPLFSTFFYQAEAWQIPMGLVAIRRAALPKVGRFGLRSPCVDYDWVLRLTARTDLLLLSEPWMDLRTHPRQITAERREEVQRHLILFLRERVAEVPLTRIAPRLSEPFARLFLAGLFKYRRDHDSAARELSSIEELAALPFSTEWRRHLEVDRVDAEWRSRYFALQMQILKAIGYFGRAS